MPVAPPSIPHRERRSQPRRHRTRPLTILVVDDKEDVRRLYEYQFRFFGADVLTANDGVEAMQFASLYQPDAILLDLAMPRMTGWEAAHHLKAEPLTRRIPIVALTGNVFEGAEDDARAAGADVFLTKPCLPRTAFETIVGLLRERRRRPRPV